MLSDATPQFPPLEITKILDTVRRRSEYLHGILEHCEACAAETSKQPLVLLGNTSKDGMPYYRVGYQDDAGNWHDYAYCSYVNNKEKIKNFDDESWTKKHMTLDQLKAYSAKGDF